MFRKQQEQPQEASQVCGCRITLDEVAEVLGGPWSMAASITGIATSLGVPVAADWAGRPSVTAADARRIGDEIARRRAEAQQEADERARQVEAARAEGVRTFGTPVPQRAMSWGTVNGKPVGPYGRP